MARQLKPGDKAPDFCLPNEVGQTVSLKSLKGKPIVLYFYPKDDTPGCTKEACHFRDAAFLVKTRVVVLGVSLDGAESHRKFIAKYGLPFSLLTDEDAAVSKNYGVFVQKNMYGRKYWGIERSTFVIDHIGAIQAIFRKVKVEGHVEAVQAVLQQESLSADAGS